MPIYPRGSEWRKWDIHVHSPLTHLQCEYKNDWKAFAKAIAKADLAAIAVTNYFCLETDELELARDALSKDSPQTVVFGNVEFRIEHPNQKGEYINIHCLFSEDIATEQINTSLSKLKLTNTRSGGKALYCTSNDIAAAGGYEAALVGLAALVNQLKQDFNFGRDVLIAACPRGLGNFRPAKGDGRGNALAVEIDRACQLMLGNEEDRKFFLRFDRYEGAVQKPVFLASDAHKIEEIGSRATWVKADPTFEGIRQTLFEPEDRIWIGEIPPETKDKNKTLSSVCVANSKGWFPDQAVPLNQGLVSVIGSKGSGKTALADVIAYGAGAWEANERSFLFRAHKHLVGARIHLTWEGGEKDEVTVGPLLNEGGAQKVKYLSQNFVERLCSTDVGGSELQQEVERVIFATLGDAERLGFSTFADLRTAKTETVKKGRERGRAVIQRLNREINSLRSQLASKPEKEKAVEALENEKAGLLKQVPQIDSSAEKDLTDELARLRGQRNTILERMAADQQMLRGVDRVREEMLSLQDELKTFAERIAPDLTLLGIGADEAKRLVPTLDPNWREMLEKKESQIRDRIKNLLGADEDPPEKETQKAIDKRIKAAEERSTLDQAKKRSLSLIQQRVAKIDAEVKALKVAIEELGETKKKEIDSKLEERWERYLELHDSFGAEEQVLDALYRPLRERLVSGGEQERRLEFFVKKDINLETWALWGEGLLDRRKAGKYRVEGELLKACRAQVLDALGSGNGPAIRAAVDALRNGFEDAGGGYTLSSQLVAGVDYAKFDDWLFSTDHIGLSYGIKFDDTELENLSPGTKGVVLLILYLEMEQNDNRPLVIDQPEENLDNESIFKVLVGYFKKAKTRRQIILITHNPNLVVNTDSEQAVVASFAKMPPVGTSKVRYFSGALEYSKRPDQGIRERVCEILEGGERAFHLREQKYAFVAP